MAIYIKGMEMPKGCRDCQFEDWGKCIAIRPIRMTRHMSEEREVYCPLTEIPEPHGRLIDESTIMDVYYERVVHKNGEFKFPMIRIIGADAPTVIERSK